VCAYNWAQHNYCNQYSIQNSSHNLSFYPPDNRYIADVVSVVREERSIRENTRQANATTNVDAKYARTENSRLESVTDDLKRTQENVKV